MADGVSFKVRGLAELSRDFGRISRKLKRDLDKELRKLAEPAARVIQEDAASHGFSSKTISGIRPGARRGGAVVRQARGRTTGNRPDFGSIQMRYAFLPGADEAEPEVIRGVEHWLDVVTSAGGRLL